jgi:zinc and cadmium transporter
MSLLTIILLASAAGGLLSVLLASVALRMRAEWVPVMVSYAIGALLGAVFLEILPHAVEHAGNFQTMGGVVLGGILGFFILEKLVLWRHCHTEHCEAHGTPAHDHDHGRSGMMITVGDTVHNFVDGVMIAAAFLVDMKLGVVTAFAIAAHEVPQELGDLAILLDSGYTRVRAFVFNFLASLTTLLGALTGYFLLEPLFRLIPLFLALSASSFIYIAVADLVPGLHRRISFRETVLQTAMILAGIGTIGLFRLWHP